MGKKDNAKKKGKGAAKTAAKTEKKLGNKIKKDLLANGEEDIETILEQIEQEEKKRSKIVETIVDPPSRRLNFTFVSHPTKEELILFGGEFYNGQKTFVYNDLYFYNLNNNTWTIVKAPAGPPPRCGHQMVMTSANKGQLWLFGGEYTSPNQSQFYHYKDLWVFNLDEKQWQKILAPNGPSPRSGHRMVIHKKMLFVFGGFHDNLRDYKYFNDLYCFNLETYMWNKLEPSGTPPSPRSGCCFVPMADGKLFLYGGYSKNKLKKDVDVGQAHTDSFLLVPDKSDSSGLKWKWVHTTPGGIRMSPRCSMPIATAPNNKAYCFGGVFDEEDEENLSGNFFNDLFAFDMEKITWRPVILTEKKDKLKARRKRDKGEECLENEASDEEKAISEEIEKALCSTTIADDGVFKVSVGPSLSSVSSTSASVVVKSNVFVPCSRMNSGLTVKHGVLYLYGGMYEIGDKQITLNDFYSLDLKKLEAWRTIIANDQAQEWLGSESESDEEGSSEENEDDDCDEAMETE